MQKTARIAGQRDLGPRNFGAPVAYNPTLMDVFIEKAYRFCVSLGKQLCIVFASVALDASAKAIKSKGSDKIQGILKGEEPTEKTEYNRNRLYGNNNNSGYSQYDKYDNMNNTAFTHNNAPGYAPGFN